MMEKSITQQKEEAASYLMMALMGQLKEAKAAGIEKINTILELNSQQDLKEVTLFFENIVFSLQCTALSQDNVKKLNEREDQSHYPGPVNEKIQFQEVAA